MATMICPTCESAFEPELSTALPFCSARCKQIDLGRWVNEEHGIPYESENDFSEGDQN